MSDPKPAEPQAVPEIPADLQELYFYMSLSASEPVHVMDVINMAGTIRQLIGRIALLESQLREAKREGWNEAIRTVKDVLHDEGWIGEAYRRINHLAKPAQGEPQ